MLRLQRIFKNYAETGSFNEQVNLYGFVDSHVFLTKSGDLGVVIEVQGVDYGATRRASSKTVVCQAVFRLR
jgi:type IV secretory pathway VirB4 component